MSSNVQFSDHIRRNETFMSLAMRLLNRNQIIEGADVIETTAKPQSNDFSDATFEE